MNKPIRSKLLWHCPECDDCHPLEIEIPEDKSDPYVYLKGLHVHAFGEVVDLPSLPITICFNDRLRISEHADEIVEFMGVDC